MKRIYVASSWRNEHQPAIVGSLKTLGFEVYDFKKDGFHWSNIDPNWKHWTTQEYRKALRHPLAVQGYKRDFHAMQWADTMVLVLPCGRSAHLELGWACGMGKDTAILQLDNREPELMAKMVDYIAADMLELVEWLDTIST